jgi:glycosyltransferase involved in cell wall biosynthesis
MIVLSYNQSRFVLETLESVKAQTYKHTELVIVDDCSSDDSVAIIDRWLRENGIRCTFIRHQKNQGICKSLNEALAASTGKYISMIASDDVWLPDKIARQVEMMESQPDTVGVLYTDAFQMDELGRPLSDMYISAHNPKLPEIPPTRVLDALLETNFIPGMTTLVRRNCYSTVGLYDESMPTEDWDMWLRIARSYSFVYSSTPVARYRIHQNSFSHSDRLSMITGTIKIFVKQFDLGHLDDGQKSTLNEMLLNLATELYQRNDAEAPEFLLAVWRTTGNSRAVWMYRFARLGVSFRTLQRANACRKRLRNLFGKLSNSMNLQSRNGP